jgi:acyl-CoA dehydrogenase
MLTLAWFVAVLAGALALAYVNASGLVWTGAIAVALGAAWGAQLFPPWVTLLASLAFVLLAIALNVPALRRKLVSEGILTAFTKVLPPMSQTEREAIEAGTVWWDAELFSGKPNWRRLLDMPRPTLTAEEQSCLDNEVETLCGMVTDWETTNVHRDLPAHVWQYIKDKGFLGLIPKEHAARAFIMAPRVTVADARGRGRCR